MSHPQATMPEWQMTPRARKAFTVLIASAVVVLLAGSAWMTYDFQFRQDSGLQACGSLAGRSSVELDESEYRTLHGMFARSARPSLREHGVRAIEAGVVAAQGRSLFAVLHPSDEEAAALRSACVAEGALAD
ncbi:hypothetical protein Ais01nite_55600 [Asanoa ishikariensis]|uniref:Uncharacterized protein n=1 Tax=Asanoa ishikariensis TaxID=137265 RepID=A0A1H3TW34_9ACTN|nr:hypothetical protein [Asanoa ishikariensis]GIF67525.1 hypothetical protein Ais01nite_55600 [Asanoa ishikariensis]SDZ53915.1 hypothetical protein SAMN05421684_6420 [Asanoa ishikariensis]